MIQKELIFDGVHFSVKFVLVPLDGFWGRVGESDGSSTAYYQY